MVGNDTHRVNGRARLVADAPFFDDLVAKAHRPILALVVRTKEVFHHRAKAILRAPAVRPVADLEEYSGLANDERLSTSASR